MMNIMQYEASVLALLELAEHIGSVDPGFLVAARLRFSEYAHQSPALL